MISLLVLSALSPAHAAEPKTCDTSTLTAEEKESGEDQFCVWDKKKKTYTAKTSSSLSDAETACLRSGACGHTPFRHGTTTDDEIDGINPWYSEQVWWLELESGFVVGGSPEIGPGTVVLAYDLGMLLELLETGHGVALAAIVLPEEFGSEGFTVSFGTEEEVEPHFSLGDASRELILGTPFDEPFFGE